MNKRAFCVITCACIGIATAAASAFGQTQQGGGYIAPPPEGHALLERASQFDHVAASALDAGQFGLAESNARQAYAIRGAGSGLTQELLAQALYAQGKTEEAFEAYRLLDNPRGGYPRNELPYALMLLKRGEWVQAVDVYSKTLRLLGQGELMCASNHFTPEVVQTKALETAIHLAMGINYNTTESWASHNQNASALIEYQKALNLAPKSALALYYYGYGLGQLKQYAKAQEYFDKAVMTDSTDLKKAVQATLQAMKQQQAWEEQQKTMKNSK